MDVLQPRRQSAWESVYYLQYHVQGGWLLRAVHHDAAPVMLVLVGVWLVEMIFRGAYRHPGGALLDRRAHGPGDAGPEPHRRPAPLGPERLLEHPGPHGFLLRLPGIGRGLFQLAAGGADFGHLTLTRFFALHAGVFSGAFGCSSGCTPG